MTRLFKTNRQLQAEHTKMHIYNTALKLLEEKNYENITIRDIVEAASVSIGTFYNYYTTKMDVFYQTYQIADRYFEEEVAPKLAGMDFEASVLTFFDYYAYYCSEATDFKMTRLLYNSDNTYFTRSSETGMLYVLKKAVERGVESGQVVENKESGEEIARFFMIAVRGLVYDWCIHKGEYDLHNAISNYVSKLLKIYSESCSS